MSFLLNDLIATIVAQDAELGRTGYNIYLFGCLVIGLAVGSYGLRLYYFGLALIGSIVGFSIFKASGADLAVSMLGAFIFSIGSIVLFLVVIFMTGFMGSLAITLPIVGLAALENMENLGGGLIICIGVSFFVGLLAIAFKNITIMFSTSVFGASLIAFLTYRLMDLGFWNAIGDAPASVVLLSVLDPSGIFASAYDTHQVHDTYEVHREIFITLQIIFSVVFFLVQLLKAAGVKFSESKKPITPNIIQRKFETFTQDKPRIKKLMLKIIPQFDPFWRQKQWDDFKSSWSEYGKKSQGLLRIFKEKRKSTLQIDPPL